MIDDQFTYVSLQFKIIKIIKQGMITIVLIIITIKVSYSDILLTTVTPKSLTISALTQYNFQISRFNINTPIPSGSTLEILFPQQYRGITPLSNCTTVSWNNVTVNCSFSGIELVVSGGFPTPINISNFGVILYGVKNPFPSGVYSSFSVTIVYPNGTQQQGISTVDVTISPGAANCSLNIINTAYVLSLATLQINYLSEYITPNISVNLRVQVPQTYPQYLAVDVQPTIIGVTPSGSYAFQFNYVSQFNMTMLMPPSTQPQVNFITIQTLIDGDIIDKCQLTISGVQPNNYANLNINTGEVQSKTNITIQLRPYSPIISTDYLTITFMPNTFDLSQVDSIKFIAGSTNDQTPIKTFNKLTISSLSSFTISNTPIIFSINSLILPNTTQPTNIVISTSTNTGYIRDSSVYTFSAISGVLPYVSLTCNNYQIGYTTDCTYSISLKNYIPPNSYISIIFPSAFIINNNSYNCNYTTTNIITPTACTNYNTNNTIIVNNINNLTTIYSNFSITISTIIPQSITTSTITITTHSTNTYPIDKGTTTLTTIKRILLSGQYQFTSSTNITYTPSAYTLNIILPFTISSPLQLSLFIPFDKLSNDTVISVNNNQLSSSYSNNILTVSNILNTQLVITGFLTHQSTQPISISANLTINSIVYFYFNGYNIAMNTPRTMRSVSLSQSSSTVYTTFVATFTLTDLKVGDLITFNSGYASTQPNCTTAVVACGVGGQVILLSVNNLLNSVTSFKINMVNLQYVGSLKSSFIVQDSSGSYLKQSGQYTYSANNMNILSIGYSQTNPYYNQPSTYTFDVSLTTPSATSLTVIVPSSYIYTASACLISCSVVNSTTSQIITLGITSNNIKFTLTLTNPPSFINPISIKSSSSNGNQDYGQLLPTSPCNSPCRNCSSTNASLCLGCYSWQQFNKLRNGTCVSDCQIGQFFNNVTNSCDACNNRCSSCVNTINNCLSCNSPFILFNSTCLANCPTGYYLSNSQCNLCITNCTQCTSITICTQCNNLTYLYNSQCVEVCPSGTYRSGVSCLACSANCLICLDITGLCSTCSSGYFIYNGLCLSECPSGLFKTSNSCSTCTTPCATCFALSSNCTSCLTTSNSISYYYLNNTCYPNSCPNTYYISLLNNVCLKCQPPCLNCNAASCLSCPVSYLYYNGYCYTTCPTSTFSNSTICLSCANPCITCLSSSQCTSCVTPYKYFPSNSSCLNSCPTFYYQDNLICYSCISPCQTCLSLTQCISCQIGYFYNSTCLSNCPSQYYIANRTCLPCLFPCSNCRSSTQCLSCQSGYYLNSFQCALTCPNYYYGKDGLCYPCKPPCSTCSSDTSCLACLNSSWYLELNKCVQFCTVLHLNNFTNICQNCRSPCLTCTFSNTCTSCLDSSFVLMNTTCIQNCPDGYYRLSANCILCPPLCASCSYSNQQLQCTRCINSTVYFYGYQCVSPCPINTTINSPYCQSTSCTKLNNCSLCSNLRCLQCTTGYTLNNVSSCDSVTPSSVIAAIRQIPIPFPFLIALVVVIVGGFILRAHFNKMYLPLFMYSCGGLLEAGCYVLWTILAYSQKDTLSYPPLAILAMYLVLNTVGLGCFCQWILPDKRFENWQLQGNKLSSRITSVVSTIISFRFYAILFSRLGHLQSFSAVVTSSITYYHANVMSALSIFIINIPALVISGFITYKQTTLNYLFFTSIEVAIISVIMFILNLLHLLTPKDYIIPKKVQYKQGYDQSEGKSVEEIMVPGHIEEYNEQQEISEEGQVGRELSSNPFSFNEDSSNNIIEPESKIELNHHEIIKYTQAYQSKLLQIQQQLIQQEQENLKREALLIAKQLSTNNYLPSRPIGSIVRQTINLLTQSSDESSSIEEEQQITNELKLDQVLSIEKQTQLIKQIQRQKQQKQDQQRHKQQQQRKKQQQQKQKQEKKRRQQIEKQQQQETIKQLTKINMLLQQLREKEEQQMLFRQQLIQLTQQQLQLKSYQFEKAREIVQRNKMGLQDKLSELNGIFNNHNQKHKIKKKKIKQIQQKRKKQKLNIKEKYSQQTAFNYPLKPQPIQLIAIKVQSMKSIEEDQLYTQQQQNIYSQLSQFTQQQQHSTQYQHHNQLEQHKYQTIYHPIPFNQTIYQQQEHQQQEQINKYESIINQPKMLVKQSKQNLAEQNNQIQRITSNLGVTHWPIDPQMEDKIKQLQDKAQYYMNLQRQKTQQLYYINDDTNELGSNTSDNLVFQQNQIQQSVESSESYLKSPILQLQGEIKLPKGRVNRRVINIGK